jgi:hypothetical protein
MSSNQPPTNMRHRLPRDLYPQPTADMPGPAAAPPIYKPTDTNDDMPAFALVMTAILMMVNAVINFGGNFFLADYIVVSLAVTFSIIASILNIIFAIGLLTRYGIARTLAVIFNFFLFTVITIALLILRGAHLVSIGDLDAATISSLVVPLIVVIILAQRPIRRLFS